MAELMLCVCVCVCVEGGVCVCKNPWMYKPKYEMAKTKSHKYNFYLLRGINTILYLLNSFISEYLTLGNRNSLRGHPGRKK